MKINWIVRIKNKAFWLAIIPAAFLLVQQILALFGVQLDFSNYVEQLLEIINTVFLILAIIGIVNDPTTEGYSDSKLALTYDEPKED